MWLTLLPQILLAVFLLLAPGLFVALSLGYRSFNALALAPALSVGVFVVSSTAAPFAGVAFGILPVGLATALIAAAGFMVSRSGHGRIAAAGPSRTGTLPFIAFAVAAALLAWRTFQVIGFPGAVSQTYDAVFHLNSVRFALDTGHASSLTIGEMTGGGFYPAGWNAVAAFVATTTGAEVAVAVNITTLILASVYWPLSCLLMTTWIVGRRSPATMAAGIACASLGAFPVLMMDFGVLYPNLLAISILPGAIALAAKVTGACAGAGRTGLPSILALLLALSGLVVSHPTTLVAWLVWTVPMVAFATYRAAPGLWQKRSADRRPFQLLVAGVMAYAFVFLVAWFRLRPPEEAAFWGPYGTVPQALGEALLFGPMDLAPAWLVAPLALLGLWSCFRRPYRIAWAAIPFLTFSAIFVVVAGFPISPVRNFLAGVWYNDSYRVAALLPVAGVLLAALGADWANTRLRAWKVWSSGGRLTARFRPYGHIAVPRPAAVIGLGVLTVAAIALGQQGSVQQAASQASTRYSMGEDSPLVSDDESELMERLPEFVPEDAVILGNPYTGAALSYALGERKSAQMHILSYVSPDLQEIYDELAALSTDPDVCAAVRSENAFFILDFGSKEVHGGSHTPPGLRHLERNSGVQLVDREGDAKLYRITGCA